MIATDRALLAALLAVVTACGPRPADVPAAGSTDDAAQEPAPTNRIDLPATVRDNLGITFADVEVRNVAQTVRMPGAFELQPLARHEYRMALSGRVELLVDEYDFVEPGDTLFRYQSPAWPELLHEIILGEQAMGTATAEIAVGRAKIAEADRVLALLRERLDGLAQAEFKDADLEAREAELEASLPRLRAELELAQTKLANAERTHEHALHRAAIAKGISEAELEKVVIVDGESVPAWSTIDWIEVRAAKAGIVEALHVTDGAFVEPPTTVLSTVDPTRVRFRALALQADLPRITGAESARIVPPPSPGIDVAEGVIAEVTVGLTAHPQERTVTLLATPTAAAEWIRPGVAAFLEVVASSTDSPALAVPRSAVVLDGLRHVFFRRDPSDPNQVIRVEADLGTSDGRWVVLESGVMRGDQVVLDGAYELKLATQQQGAAQKGGHFHADGSFHGDH